MNIICHRGYWQIINDQNSKKAFEKSFELGFGVETDFRDANGDLVIAHDLPGSNPLLAEEFFGLANQNGMELPIAINIKSDGLQLLLSSVIKRFKINNYFLFDMSVPDAVISIKSGLRVFTRQSDLECNPAFYDKAAGVWIDSFHDDSWIDGSVVLDHLANRKSVCLVSPEIHKRKHIDLWDKIKNIDSNRLYLCTDKPDEAAIFFQKKND
jgi:hypothetical protein